MILSLNIIAGLVALIHIWFMVLESILWTKPLGLKTFGMSAADAANTKVLAMNQGLYNGILAAGLIWGIIHPFGALGLQIKGFFLCAVAVAGVFGSYTVSRKIFFLQALPALIGLVLEWWILR